ncbi:hypothetical protein LCGC14_2793240 [marine sediment metagenome]|uniref:Uncharacterized protein n=1 Tax=marine sediment metagenome TaxID=412755 RepID=A0A0F8ZC34_9ZZZZ
MNQKAEMAAKGIETKDFTIRDVDVQISRKLTAQAKLRGISNAVYLKLLLDGPDNKDKK